MKFLLIIPILALFLSNVPFKMEINMPLTKGKEECCMKEKREQMNCHPVETDVENEQGCSPENRCSYVCCLQVFAPNQPLLRFKLLLVKESSVNGYYQSKRWNNPFIDGPLQPPDMV